MVKATIRQKVLCSALIIALGCPTCFARYQEAWKQLKLDTTRIAGATVYYEKCFEPNLPEFESVYKQFLDEKGKLKKIVTNNIQIVTEINQILGATEFESEAKKQAGMLDAVSRIMSQIANAQFTFSLARVDTIKDYFRSGGQLPDWEYNKTTDKITYQGFFFDGRIAYDKTSDQVEFIQTKDADGSSLKELDWPILIDSNQTFEEAVGDSFQYMRELTDRKKYGLAIHEVTEMTIVLHTKLYDVHWRWFTDGVADAVTYELLRRHFGQKDAAEWSDHRNVSDYNDIEKEINLMYWMHCPYDVETTLKYESRLNFARYAYSMHEAQRLIKKYSLGCLRKILNKVCSKRDRRSEDLFQAIKEVTSEDMRERLGRYQTFEGTKEGTDKYNRLFEAARKQEDYEQMLINLLRRLELCPSPFLLSSLKIRKDVSNLLFKLGYEETGDKTMLGVLEKLKEPGFEAIYDYFSELFLDYALECDNPQKGEKIAKEVLSKNPYSFPALTVRMRILYGSGNFGEAKKIADNVLVLVDDANSVYGKAAQEVLRLTGTNSSPVSK